MKLPTFEFNEEEGLALFTIYYKDKVFIGSAMCCEDDRPHMSKETGSFIAQTRAEIDYFRYIRDTELKPAYRTLRQLYYSINRSKSYNEKSYEARSIRRQMYQAEEDLQYFKDLIKLKQDTLQTYLKEKENQYKKDKED